MKQKYLQSSSETDIKKYMFGDDVLAVERFNKYDNSEKNAYMVGFLSSALQNAHIDLKNARGE